jgi:hypothetical protein
MGRVGELLSLGGVTSNVSVKRKVKIIIYASVVFLVLIVGYFLTAWPSRAGLDLSFVGYTNDYDGFRTNWYRVPDGSDRSMAVFCLANHSKRMFTHYEGFAEVRMPTGWAADTNQLPIPHTTAAVLEPSQTILLSVATPTGTPSWRCSIALTRFTQHPYWQWRLTQLLSKVGIHFDKEEFTISSREIER